MSALLPESAGLAIIYLFPYLTKVVPSPLVTILALTGVTLHLGLDVRTAGDMGELPDSLPVFLLPDIPRSATVRITAAPSASTLSKPC